MSKNFLGNKTILVTGAAGSIGSALCRKLMGYKFKKLILLDNNETGLFDIYEELKSRNVDYVLGDIRDVLKIEKTFKKYKPQIVFHVAAYKHLKLVEKYPEEAESVNVYGTTNLIESAQMVGVEKFVFVSTDKAVNPSSTMGWSKKECEDLCLRANGDTKFMIVRFGNVMPSRGSVVPIFQKALEENKDLIVTHKDMKRYFLGIYEAVDLILEATKKGKGGEIFVLDMGKPIYIKELAEMMIKLSGKPLNIKYSRPGKGEKFDEELMTKEEKKIAKKVGRLYIIKPKYEEELRRPRILGDSLI